MNRSIIVWGTFTVCLMVADVKPALAQFNSILPGGFGIEMGAGHNQLFWESEDNDGTIEFNRTAISLMPSARIHYQFSVSKSVDLYSFLGYNEFGGWSKETNPHFTTDPDVRYKDRVRFQNLEGGFFGLFEIKEFNVGMGVKLNHHLSITNRSYYENHPQGNDGWSNNDISFFFNDWSFDSGLRIETDKLAGIHLGWEGWFGLSNLADSDSGTMNIRQNHCRLLVGYRF